MSLGEWSWVAAKSTGTSHIRSGIGCDDFAACVEVNTPNGSLLIPVVSDGAGSARYSSLGSRICCRVFVQNAVQFFSAGGTFDSLSSELIYGWLDEMRDRIGICARDRGTSIRDFAATFVAALVFDERALFFHIGDGAAVYSLDHSGPWVVASWPDQGEYASTTYFVTDDPVPRLRLVSVDEKVSRLALFTDGIERLVLNFSTRSAHDPFFNNMLESVGKGVLGRDRKLSSQLGRFLDSPAVCNRTDDDKTLILAKRIETPHATLP
jgi:Protein phosphatase 2C